MLSDEFLYELAQTSKRLGVKPMDLLSVMERESGINPAAYNENGGATGLIQFMPSTAKGLGTTTEALRNMSAVEQLPFVEKFYKQAGFKGGNAGDLYATTFLPARVGRDVLTTEGESFYDANKVLDTNNDGRITTAELAKRAESGYRNVRGLLSNREMSPGGTALPFDINERGVPTEFIPPTPMNLPSSPAPQVAPQGVPQDMPQVAPQTAPQAQPKERSFLDRAIDFASNVGAPLQQIGQGVALLEGDLQSAQALGQMVEGNQKQAQVKARNNATVKLLQDYGLSESQAKNFVESGLAGNFLAEAMKSKKADVPTKIKMVQYLVDQYGIPEERALKMVFSGGTNINIGDKVGAPILSKDEKFMIVQDPNSPSGFVRVPIEETKTKEQLEKEVEAEKQQRGKSTIFSSNIQSALDIIAEAGEDPFALPVVGNIAESLSGLPITPQGYIDLRERLVAVKSQLAVDTLGNLKKSSPTGASGFGQLSDKERKVIESLQGSLDQSQSKGQITGTLKAIDAFGKYLTYGIKDPNTGEYRNATQEELDRIIKGDTSMLDIASPSEPIKTRRVYNPETGELE